MMLLALVLQVAGPNEVAQTKANQARVDQLLDRCGAKSFVALQALGPNQVALQFRNPEAPPTPTQERVFDCVLNELKALPDIQFGFLGNEVAPESEKN